MFATDTGGGFVRTQRTPPPYGPALPCPLAAPFKHCHARDRAGVTGHSGVIGMFRMIQFSRLSHACERLSMCKRVPNIIPADTYVVTPIVLPLSNLYSRLFLIITHCICLCATSFLQIRHSCISDHFTGIQQTTHFMVLHRSELFPSESSSQLQSASYVYFLLSPHVLACAFHISLAIC